MAQCNWDPKKHGGKPCPVHGGGGLWDENVFTRNEKLKKAGYTKEDLEDEDLKEDFDMNDEEEFKPTTDDFMEELSDNDYIYGGLDEEKIYNLMAERLSKKYDIEITPEEVAKNLKEGGFTMDEYNKYLDGDGNNDSEDYSMSESEDDKPYDFDKWAKETNYDKTTHVGYLDENKVYKPEELMKKFLNDEDWDAYAAGGEGNMIDGFNNVYIKHKSGPYYIYDKKTGKVKLMPKNKMPYSR